MSVIVSIYMTVVCSLVSPSLVFTMCAMSSPTANCRRLLDDPVDCPFWGSRVVSDFYVGLAWEQLREKSYSCEVWRANSLWATLLRVTVTPVAILYVYLCKLNPQLKWYYNTYICIGYTSAMVITAS